MSLSDAQYLFLDGLCKGTTRKIDAFRGKRPLGTVPAPTLQALVRLGYVEARQSEIALEPMMGAEETAMPVPAPEVPRYEVQHYVTEAGRAAYDVAAERWRLRLTEWRTRKGVVTVPRWAVEELLKQRGALAGPDAASACDVLAQVLG